MTSVIGLIGGDEFGRNCVTMDRIILKATGVACPTVLVIPTAAAKENPLKAIGNGVAHFEAIGAKATGLLVLNKKHANDDELLSSIDLADVIYFTGGDPKYLLATLEGSVLLAKTKMALSSGKAVVGSSAGAMVLGSWMRSDTWVRALEVVTGVAVLPHHEGKNPKETSDIISKSAPEGLKIIGIDVATGCLVSEDHWKVTGKGSVTVYYSGKWCRFGSGEQFSLATCD